MNSKNRLLFVFLTASLLLTATACSALRSSAKTGSLKHTAARVVLGNENFLQNYLHLVHNKRVALLTNPSGVNHRLQSSADVFMAHPQINLVALFGPEHGIRGAVYAGAHIENETDPHTGLPVYSLYGKQRKPTAQMLKDIDVILVDIQDIGVRAYTYIYTMAKVMEAAAEYGKEVIVLDRPNPIDGEHVEGNLVEPGFFSFVGLYPIPYRHGLTIGELAQLFNNEYNIHCKLTVVPLKNWRRNMLWGDTGLLWVPTSPHVPHWQTVLFMSTTGTIGELDVLSEGVGYTSPFELIGAPWIDSYAFAAALNDLHLPGILFRPLYFKPYYRLFKGQVCQGVQLHISDPRKFNSYTTGLYILQTALKLYPQQDILSGKARVKVFNKVLGCDWITKDLLNQVPVSEIQRKWQKELHSFLTLRQKYLLYE